MGSARYAVEFETVQGTALRFGPYDEADAARIAADFAPHIGRNDFVFSPATSSSGRPIGAWSLCASGIAAVRVVPCASRASGRLSRPSWSRPSS